MKCIQVKDVRRRSAASRHVVKDTAANASSWIATRIPVDNLLDKYGKLNTNTPKEWFKKTHFDLKVVAFIYV